MPAHLPGTRPPTPLRGDQTPLAVLHHRGPHRDHGPRRDGADTTPPLQRRRRPEPRRFPLKPLRLSLHAGRFEREATPLCVPGLARSRCSAEPLPRRVPASRPRHRDGHRTTALVRQPPVVPKTPRPRLELALAHLARRPRGGRPPNLRRAPDAAVPPPWAPRAPHRRLRHAASGQPPPLAGPRPAPLRRCAYLLGGLHGHQRPARLAHPPRQRHRATAGEPRHTAPAGGVPPPRGLPGPLPPRAPPAPQRLREPRARERLRGEAGIGEPTAQAAPNTLRRRRTTDRTRGPSSEAHGGGADEASHPPGQGLAVAQGDPLRRVAQDAKQRLRESRGVLHGSLRRQRPGVEDPSSHQGRRRGAHALLTMSLICS